MPTRTTLSKGSRVTIGLVVAVLVPLVSMVFGLATDREKQNGRLEAVEKSVSQHEEQIKTIGQDVRFTRDAVIRIEAELKAGHGRVPGP